MAIAEPDVVTAKETESEPAVETVPEIEVDVFCATNDHCTMYVGPFLIKSIFK